MASTSSSISSTRAARAGAVEVAEAIGDVGATVKVREERGLLGNEGSSGGGRVEPEAARGVSR